MSRSFSWLWIFLLGALPEVASAETVELRLGDRVILLDGARVNTDGERLVITAPPERMQTSGGRCEVSLGEAERLHLGSVAAEHLSIRLSGASRLTVEQLTGQLVDITLDGAGRLEVQEASR